MSDIILGDAMKDRSFAGLFPYEKNGPMKVFAGDAPVVPPETQVNAAIVGLGEAIVAGQMADKAPRCFPQCQKMYNECMKGARHGDTPFGSDVPDASWSACKALSSMCLIECVKGKGKGE
jgi:hypothetical protein